MTKTVTPASIVYEVEGEENKIEFHAVMIEDHTASTQITKYPVQTGFEISNHAIRKNRQFNLQAIITNTLLDKNTHLFDEDKKQQSYSTNNSKTMFKVLESLVQSATSCKVITNLGVYNPVIFTKFSTKQQVGRVDSMLINMVGEEIQLSNTVSKSAPKALTFRKATDAEVVSISDTFIENEIPFDPEAVDIFLADVDLGTDFIVSALDSSGLPFDTTFLAKAQDLMTGGFMYEIQTTLTDVYDNVTSFIDNGIEGLIPDLGQLAGGFLGGVTSCLLGGAAEIAGSVIGDYIDTGLGKLKKGAHGAIQDIMNLGGSGSMQALLGVGADCITAEFSQTLGGQATTATGAINEGLSVLKDIGDAATGGVTGLITAPAKLIKLAPKIKGPLADKGYYIK